MRWGTCRYYQRSGQRVNCLSKLACGVKLIMPFFWPKQAEFLYALWKYFWRNNPYQHRHIFIDIDFDFHLQWVNITAYVFEGLDALATTTHFSWYMFWWTLLIISDKKLTLFFYLICCYFSCKEHMHTPKNKSCHNYDKESKSRSFLHHLYFYRVDVTF